MATQGDDGSARPAAFDLEAATARAAESGMGLIGAFAPAPEDGAPPGAATLALLGYDGPSMWRAFSAAPESGDGRPNPLDRWSKRAGDAVADALGATAHYPFDRDAEDRPWPFLRWAMRAEAAWSSPVGLLISAERGLWSSYRLAIASAAPLEATPAPGPQQRPCDACAERPCRSACPVDAFSDAGYDVDACAAHLRTAAGADCLENGCLARRACPVGVAYAHTPAQATFHMRAFLAGRSRS